MTTTFRIGGVRADTVNGPDVHTFPSDLTVLAGDTGVGKTTLLELVKYALGGDGLLAPVVTNSITDVHVSVRVGDSRYEISRSIDVERRRTVRVLDLVTRDRLPDHSVGGEPPTISSLLMTSLGLEAGLRAAARSHRSTSAGAQITFNDLFRFMYIPQADMNRDIAGSNESYYAPKRKAVFELLFALTNADLLRKRSEINTLRADLVEAEKSSATVEQFLADSGLQTRIEAELQEVTAQTNERVAASQIAALQNELSDAADRETQVMRDLLGDAERGLAEARNLAAALEREHLEYADERRRVVQDVARLERMAAAGDRLANIEFAVCPRCTQSLSQRDVPQGNCRVCLQADIVPAQLPGDQYETAQLRSQLDEIDIQLAAIDEQSTALKVTIAQRGALIGSLTADIDARTSARVTPRLQAYADAVAMHAEAQAAQKSMEIVLRQWDRAEDLRAAAERISSRRAALSREVEEAERTLTERRDSLIADLSAEFQATVISFGIPSIERAEISADTYLPLLNGQPFDQVSRAGGIMTATQVAYWLSLVTVAVRRGDTYMPGFLLIDSPRLALNSAEALPAQMYRRFVTQVAVVPGRLQFIVADNELPPEYGKDFAEIDFSYARPTIGTIDHPGPANVKPIVEVPEIV